MANSPKRCQNRALKHIPENNKDKQIRFLFRYIVQKGDKEAKLFSICLDWHNMSAKHSILKTKSQIFTQIENLKLLSRYPILQILMRSSPSIAVQLYRRVKKHIIKVSFKIAMVDKKWFLAHRIAKYQTHAKPHRYGISGPWNTK
jgi:hypothetical protein